MKRDQLKKGTPKKPPLQKSFQLEKPIAQNRYIDLLGLAIVILLGIIIYSNSFNCSFHFDDQNNIIDNKIIRNLSDVKAIWNYSQTRFVAYYTFAVNYHFDKLNVWGYHLVNLGIHLINSLLVWWLTMLIFTSPSLKENSITRHKNLIAFFTALLFVSHPLATQSVTYIVQRMASLAATFYFLSLALYIKGRILSKGNFFKYLLFLGSLISGVLALLTKENAFTLPFTIVLLEIFFLQIKNISINFKDSKVIVSVLVLICFLVAVLSAFSLSIFKTIYPGEFYKYTVTSVNYLLTQFSVIIKYIQLLFLPINQNLDYDYRISNSFFEPRTFISFLALSSIVILAIFLFKKHRLLSFCIFWFFITLAVESSFIPISDLIFEHRTYLPSFGFFLMLSSGIFILLWNKNKYIAIFILTIIIGSNSYMTYARNKVWKNDLTLYSDVVSKSPNKARPHFIRGSYLMKESKNTEALSEFNKAIALYKGSAKAYNNRGLAFRNEKKYDQALNDFDQAIQLDRKYAEAYVNKGNILRDIKSNYEEALKSYNQALDLNPKIFEGYANRGTLFLFEKRYDEAIQDFNKTIELEPDFAEAYYNRGIVFYNMKKYGEAVVSYNKAIELKSDYPEAYFSRGVSEYYTDKKDAACNDLKTALDLGYQPARDLLKQFCK
jgi:tetratricopeptide (TPR) repeat protein